MFNLVVGFAAGVAVGHFCWVGLVALYTKIKAKVTKAPNQDGMGKPQA